MGLPTSRDFDFDVLTEVPSAVLNHIQDCIITLNTQANVGRRAATRTVNLGLDVFIPQVAADWVLADQLEDGSSGGTGLKRTLAGTAESKVFAYLPLDVGDELLSYTLDLLDPDTAHRTTVVVQRITLANGLSQEEVDDPPTTPSVAGPGMTTVSLTGINITLAARNRLQLCITTTKVGVHLFGIELELTHPS